MHQDTYWLIISAVVLTTCICAAQRVQKLISRKHNLHCIIVAASIYAYSNLGVAGRYTLAHTVHPCSPAHRPSITKPVLSEETISGTRGTTHRRKINQQVENEHTTRRRDIVKTQKKYKHMKHMLKTCEHTQRSATVQTLQQWNKDTALRGKASGSLAREPVDLVMRHRPVPHTQALKHQWSEPHPSQAPSTNMDKLNQLTVITSPSLHLLA